MGVSRVKIELSDQLHTQKSMTSQVSRHSNYRLLSDYKMGRDYKMMRLLSEWKKVDKIENGLRQLDAHIRRGRLHPKTHILKDMRLMLRPPLIPK